MLVFLLLVFTVAPGRSQANGGPWKVLTFSGDDQSSAEIVMVDHLDPSGVWLESRAWILDPNGRRLAIGGTAMFDSGSVTTALRLSDVSARRDLELTRDLRGLTADGTAFGRVSDLLGSHTLTRLQISLRTGGAEDDFTATIAMLKDANDGRTGWLAGSLEQSSVLRQFSFGEPTRRSLVFVQDAACPQLPKLFDVFCTEIVPALLRGRPRAERSSWTLTESVSLRGETAEIQRVLRTFPRRDRRTRYDVRER